MFRENVIADRRTGEVLLRTVVGTVASTERVAKWVGDHFRLRGEALTLKARIEELLAERRNHDELSEDTP